MTWFGKPDGKNIFFANTNKQRKCTKQTNHRGSGRLNGRVDDPIPEQIHRSGVRKRQAEVDTALQNNKHV
jgi:hypothetical protein